MKTGISTLRNKLSRIRPDVFFIWAALIIGGFYFFMRPPLQSPDEFNHFLRAYQVSEGHFLPEKKDHRLGGNVPVCLDEFFSLYRASTFIYEYRLPADALLQGFEVPSSDSAQVFMDFPNTSYYSPVSYLPQALALFVLRQFNCSVGTLYHGARLFTFLCWVLCMLLVIRLLPLYKWLFVLLLLQPMSLYVAVSFSADNVTNMLTLLLIAFILRLMFRETPILRKELLLILVIALLLAFTKIVYLGLLLLLFAVPATRFGSRAAKYGIISTLLLISFLATWFWSGVVMQYYISFEEYNPDWRSYATLHSEANYYRQKAHLLANPFHFFKVVYNSITKDTWFYLVSYVGRFGTYMHLPVPGWLAVSAFCVIVFVALTEPAKVRLSLTQKAWLLLAALCTYALLILSQHLTWNKIGNDIVDSFQGRYLVPILPLIFMLFNNSWQRWKLQPLPFVLFFVLIGNTVALGMFYKNYYKELYQSRVEIRCSMEELSENGRLKTSDPSLTLGGADKRTEQQHRSGTHSLMLLPDSSAGHYAFKDLKRGDFIEIYAWQKGKDGELVIDGKGRNCNPYHYINHDIQLRDKQGWKKMLMMCGFTTCDSSEVVFYVHNAGKDTIYFDDLRYSIKRKP